MESHGPEHQRPPDTKVNTVSLRKSPRKKLKLFQSNTDYQRCVLCQTERKSEQLYNIKTTEKLKTAMQFRQDDTAQRLECDMNCETWIETNKPMWHTRCRNTYTQEKLYKLAAKRRQHQNPINSNPSTECEASTSALSSDTITRSSIPDFDAKEMCVICGKARFQGYLPTSKVTVPSIKQTLIDNAKSLGREDILYRLESGSSHDLVANDICYHRTCMNRFRASRSSVKQPCTANVFDAAFSKLVLHIDKQLFQEHKGISMKDAADMYNSFLQELSVNYIDTSYKTHRLQTKLTTYYGNRVSILHQTGGSGFMCASDIPLGDALTKLHKLREQARNTDMMLLDTAKLMREDTKVCKSETHNKDIAISHSGACEMIPDSFYNFCCGILDDTVSLPPAGSNRVVVDKSTEEKAVLMAQQMLHHITPINTPLSIGTAYYLYNQTRSKSLITLNNKLHVGVSYDTLNRQLTSACENIMTTLEETGVYIPQNIIANTQHPPVFAVDNLDWKRKTLEGGSFNATTSVIIQNVIEEDTHVDISYKVPSAASGSRTPAIKSTTSRETFYVSKQERKQSRSLEDILSTDELATDADGIADDLLLLWQLGRFSASQVWDISEDEELGLPSFRVFCASISPNRLASQIGYLPLVPFSPTDPSVLKDVMTNLVKVNQELGHVWTIIAGDQATYELAVAIRKKETTLDKVILVLGGFHLTLNYLRAICRIIQDAGEENLLVEAGLFSEGTSRKVFSEKANYYQTLYAVNILNEAFRCLYFEAFEEWLQEHGKFVYNEEIELLLREFVANTITPNELLNKLGNIQTSIGELKACMGSFEDSLRDKPTAIFWLTFMKMADNLHRFMYYEREASWKGHLCEAAKMLPFLTAAGHHKYGQHSLPIYLHEMKQLPTVAPLVHDAMMNGAFVGRRTDGIHNSVSPDMLLEQTYNADAKEESGLDGITLNEAARAKWIYTKPITATITAQLKDMLHVKPGTERHHGSGETTKSREKAYIDHVITAVETNPFKEPLEHLINISTGVIAETCVHDDLTSIEATGYKALHETLGRKTEGGKKIVKLNTFHTQQMKSKKPLKPLQKNADVTALIRMTQIIACGGQVDILHVIGEHECSEFPPSLFTNDGQLRSHGVKSSLVKTLLKKSGSDVLHTLPEEDGKTVVIIDAMHLIRKWSFQKGELYNRIAERYKAKLLNLIPSETKSIHFCCDRYGQISLKEGERQHRNRNRVLKTYEVMDGFSAPDRMTSLRSP